MMYEENANIIIGDSFMLGSYNTRIGTYCLDNGELHNMVDAYGEPGSELPEADSSAIYYWNSEEVSKEEYYSRRDVLLDSELVYLDDAGMNLDEIYAFLDS